MVLVKWWRWVQMRVGVEESHNVQTQQFELLEEGQTSVAVGCRHSHAWPPPQVPCHHQRRLEEGYLLGAR